MAAEVFVPRLDRAAFENDDILGQHGDCSRRVASGECGVKLFDRAHGGGGVRAYDLRTGNAGRHCQGG